MNASEKDHRDAEYGMDGVGGGAVVRAGRENFALAPGRADRQFPWA